MKTRIAIILMIICVSFGFSVDSAVWQKRISGIYESDIRTIFIHPKDENVIFAGTSKALYQSTDGGRNYQMILRASGELRAVNDVYISEDQPEMAYAATDAGLYMSRDTGKNWERIYYSSSLGSRRCISVIWFKNRIYLGTEDGVFMKDDEETEWRGINGRFSKKSVYHFAQDKSFIYFATGQKLYRFNKQTSKVRQVFSLGSGERLERDDLEEEFDGKAGNEFIKSVRVSNGTGGHLFIGATKGIYMSSDFGENWKLLPSDNLAIEELRSLSVRKAMADNCQDVGWGCLRVLAGTNKGVFFLEDKQWMPLYRGMETNVVNDIAENKIGTVYAATAKGIFYLSDEKALPLINNDPGLQISKPAQIRSDQTHTDRVGRYGFHHEPTINEVHEWAIHYAEVDRSKIENWRKLARNKALMPSLSVGLDRDATDLFHWNTGASPDEIQKGRDFIDWDVSLSWDLANIVWSTDQTTIDSRSKLMVELREDLLNEVTRLYFERRRIQVEMISEDMNSPYTLDKEMRVAELTALIDALTGGEFSKRIKNNSKAGSRQSSAFSE